MSTEVAPTETPAAPASQGATAPGLVPTPPAPRAANPLDLAPSEFREALARRSENRRALIEWIRASLVDGVDFGAVPLRRGGYSKPSLRKPGAEKICGMLGVTASFPTLKDYETAALEGRRLEQIILRCHLASPDGQIVADGVGARAVEQDRGDLNKSLKMAVKSAMIDATLRMAGLSEIFTQDLEDMPHGALDGDTEAPVAAREAGSTRETAGSRPHAVRRADSPAGRPDGARAERSHGTDTGDARHGGADPRDIAAQRGERLATERQVKLIRVRLERAGIAESELLERFGIPNIESLPFSKVSPALHWIDALAA
jgi:hypothetical protein